MNTPYDYYSAVQDYLAQQGHEGAGLEREAARVNGELEKVFAGVQADDDETKRNSTTAGAKPSNTVS